MTRLPTRRDLPPLAALKAFEATARLGSLTAAAVELFVTHGAVSRHIRALEDWTGVALFERTGKRLKLTDAGARYRDEVGTAFDGIAAATERLRASAGKPRQLTVNALPTFAMRWLLPRLARFQQVMPQVELRLVTSDEAVERLAHGSYDIAIRREVMPFPSGIAGAAFLEEREIPVAAPDLLARMPVAVPADLVKHTLLHADTRPGAWSRWLAAAGAEDAGEKAARQDFDHFYLALQAASDGLGVALGPLPIIADDIRTGRLATVLQGPALSSRPYCWLAPEAQVADPLIAAFCTWLEEEGMTGET
ncbi:transcriptional regulator GcvA [Parvibaculum sp.]|uniref:transcriptional regulator GcvA n=1 Tax=Parvibaculum sp. TaxID=2024848 RepID=UPI003BA9D8B4